jgi:DNA repair protein RadC
MNIEPSQSEFGFDESPKPSGRKLKPPQEFKIISLRDSPVPFKKWACETAEDAVEYWKTQVATAPWYSHDRECTVAILLNVRCRIFGHHLISIGLLDAAVVHPREVFRAAIIANAHSIILGHNHPSDDPAPSHADIAATRELLRAGQHLRIHILDHIIVGNPGFASLKALGHME